MIFPRARQPRSYRPRSLHCQAFNVCWSPSGGCGARTPTGTTQAISIFTHFDSWYGKGTNFDPLQILILMMGGNLFATVLNWIQGLGHVTSEKQAPSALDYLGAMKEAVALEKRACQPGTSKALKDVLNRCIAEYNKMCTNRRHRIDSDKKKLILNLFLCFNSCGFWFPVIINCIV